MKKKLFSPIFIHLPTHEVNYSSKTAAIVSIEEREEERNQKLKEEKFAVSVCQIESSRKLIKGETFKRFNLPQKRN